MTVVEAAKLLAVLCTAFPDGMRFLSEDQQADTRALYRMYLEDWPYAVGDAAVRRIVASYRRWPTIADIRQACTAQTYGRQRLAGEAWGDVKALRTPQERPITDLDPALRACIISMGWIQHDTLFRGSAQIKRWRVVTGDNEAADRAKFCEMYEQLAQRITQDRVVGQLAPALPRSAALTGETVGSLLGRLLPTGKDR